MPFSSQQAKHSQLISLDLPIENHFHFQSRMTGLNKNRVTHTHTLTDTKVCLSCCCVFFEVANVFCQRDPFDLYTHSLCVRDFNLLHRFHARYQMLRIEIWVFLENQSFRKSAQFLKPNRFNSQ